MGRERADAFVRSVPLRRTGEPEEIAAVVNFPVSDTASYVTAQVICVGRARRLSPAFPAEAEMMRNARARDPS